MAELFAAPEHCNLRLRFGAKEPELFASAAALCTFSRNFEEHLLQEVADLEFLECLPGEGLCLNEGDLPDWRRVLAELHALPLPELRGPVAAPPLLLKDVSVVCLCAPSVADVRLTAPSAGRVWEFLCDSRALQQVPFFTAALGSWKEGRSRHVHFPDEDAWSWCQALLQLHKCQDLPKLAELRQLEGIDEGLQLLALYRKYLMVELERSLMSRLREGEWVPALASMDQEDFLGVAEALERLQALEPLLGCWCLARKDLMARPLELLLRHGFAQSVARSPGALAYIASGQFLSRAEASFPLLLLAERPFLEALLRCQRWELTEPQVLQLLGEDALMPLTQLPSLKSALRQRRFSAEVGRALEPFPRLLEDLLDAWFGDDAEVRPEDLAAWARCARFRRSALPRHLARLSFQGLGRFVAAGAGDAGDAGESGEAEAREVLQVKRDEVYQSLFRATPLVAAPWFRDAGVMHLLWQKQVMAWYHVTGVLSCLIFRPCLALPRLWAKESTGLPRTLRDQLGIEAMYVLDALSSVRTLNIFFLKLGKCLLLRILTRVPFRT
ncbi:unnamed protein product [Effrenium voratum]|nr:unnamed protein product [Effrenium voratum]